MRKLDAAVLREVEKSKRARPMREKGRERLLEAARALFRAKPKHQVSRLEIARHAGVSPALLTYHYSRNRDLVIAAAQPVMTKAIEDLYSAIDSDTSYEERLYRVIVLFLDFAEQNASLLDIYTEAVVESRDPVAQAVIGSALDKLGQFFHRSVQGGAIAADTNPRFLLLALWGICRLVGGFQPLPLLVFDRDLPPSNARQAQASLILKLILQGAGGDTMEAETPRS